MFSVRYYFDEVTPDNLEPEGIDLPGFSYYDTQNGFHIYKNDYALPMGFTFDTYVSRSQWETYSESDRCNLLLRALVLEDDAVETYQKDMQKLPDAVHQMSDEDLLAECTERAKTACDSFTYNSKGFHATISTDHENLVFFSVPWEEGWSAEVNGEPVAIEKADIGFMAVPVAAGDSEITFTYHTPGLKAGALLSLSGLVLFAGYLTVAGIWNKRHPSPKAESVCCMDYSAEETAN